MRHKSAITTSKSSMLTDTVLRPFQEFAHTTVSSGVLLLACPILALLWANSPWSQSYVALWEQHVVLGLVRGIQLDHSLHVWINEGLMALFFLLVGLEIKRELLVGELSRPRQAALPIIAAVGGACFPALIYLAFAWRTAAAGWGIPMATDTAFALGILTLLGQRIPLALIVFLTALAIVDDLIAVLMIALFYAHGINWLALGFVGIFQFLLCACNAFGIRRPLVYTVLGTALWFALLQSGIHATIAGILVAVTIPARSRTDVSTFLHRSRTMLDEFEQGNAPGGGLAMDERQQTTLRRLGTEAEAIQAPLQRIEHALHWPVSSVILPLFILANAGVQIDGSALLAQVLSPVSLGIAVGLLVGKQLGITLFSWVAVTLHWAILPTGVRWRHIYGVGWLGGIGFTMSLFIADLAFAPSQMGFLSQAKIAILLVFLVASMGGFLLLRFAKTGPPETSASMPLPSAGNGCSDERGEEQ